MRFVPNSVTRAVAMNALKIQKQNPKILFGLGVVGMVGTVVLASRATLKLEDVLENAQADLVKVDQFEHTEYSETDRQKDKITIYVRLVTQIGRLYGPTILVGAASIACLTGSHHILSKRNANLTAAYVALDKAFQNYKQRVVDAYGPEKEREINYPTKQVEEVNDETGKKEKVVVPSGIAGSPYARVFDEYNPNWNKTPEYNQFFISSTQNYANDLLKAQGHVFLNEVYDMLGMDRSKEGAVVGWIYGKGYGDDYIDFGVFSHNRNAGKDFVHGREHSVWLDFNVDGIIYDKI